MSGPAMGKRRLRAELRRLRVDRNLTQDTVASDMEWSLSKLIRIENGTVAISVSDLRSLLAYYGVRDPQQVDSLLDLARAAKRRNWWDEYKNDVSGGTITYTGFESEAVEIGYWTPVYLPGLLQTQRYASAVISRLVPELDAQQVERRVEFRLRRQEEVIGREDPPRVVATFDESVLRRRPDGNEETLREQLTHLVALTKHPHVAIQVVPLTAGAHPGWYGAITVLEFGDDDQVLYTENGLGENVLWEEQNIVDHYRDVLAELRQQALSVQESAQLIESVAQNL